MTTAREQAREAADLLITRLGDRFVNPSPDRAADAASDVWEPLLRECFAILEEFSEYEGYCPRHLVDRVAKIEEVLGNG